MLEVVGAIIAPTTVVIGLLYYFGWVHTQAIFVYFGIDVQLIDYGPSDYILRSSSILFNSLIRVVFLALIMVGLHRFVVRRALDTLRWGLVRRVLSRLGVIAHIVGVALAIVIIVGVLAPNEVGRHLGLVAPLLLVASVLLLGYAPYLRSVSRRSLIRTGRNVPTATTDDQSAESDDDRGVSADQRPIDDVNEQRRGKQLLDMLRNMYSGWLSSPVDLHSPIRVSLLLTLGLTGVLWAVSLYAYQDGVKSAVYLAGELPGRPVVVLYSVERVSIDGPGVKVAEIAQSGSKYRYQYSGIRLLSRSADKYLLLPKYWQRGRDRVFVVRDDDSIRIDVAAH